MTLHELLGVGLSVVAVAIAAHTKYQQRKKKRLGDLASELKTLTSHTELFIRSIRQPRTDEDMDLRLSEIPREMLACKHKTGDSEVSLISTFTKGIGDESTEINTPSEITRTIQNGSIVFHRVRVGNRSAMHASDYKHHLTDPFRHAGHIYSQLEQIETDFGDIVAEFDEDMFGSFEKTLNTTLENHSRHLLNNSSLITVDVDAFDDADSIGNHIFDKMYSHDGIKKELDDIESQIQEIENFRTTVLQTSYS